MYVSTTEINVPEAMTVSVTEDALAVQLSDGRDISVPLSWYPRLVHATPEERGHLELIGGGQGIHWPDLDEDISVEMLLAGRKSGESRRSFKQWLEAKQAGRGLTLYELTAHEQTPENAEMNGGQRWRLMRGNHPQRSMNAGEISDARADPFRQGH